MNNEFQLIKAAMPDLDGIMEVIKQAVKVMEDHQIDQWDERYPTNEIIKNDIINNQLYIGKINGSIAVVFVLNQEFDEEYESGNWKYKDLPFTVIHRLCVNPAYQNQGLGTKTMLLIEDLLKKERIQSIRLDAFSQNPYALKMYEKIGYNRVGEAVWRKGLFYLYEKKI